MTKPVDASKSQQTHQHMPQTRRVELLKIPPSMEKMVSDGAVIRHEVVRGDSLWDLWKKHSKGTGTSFPEFIKLNAHITQHPDRSGGDFIYPRDEVLLPVKQVGPKKPADAKAQPATQPQGADHRRRRIELLKIPASMDKLVSSGSVTRHEVASGDTLWTLWKHHGKEAGTSFPEFLELNAHITQHPERNGGNLIYPHDEVLLPTKRSEPNKPDPFGPSAAGASASVESLFDEAKRLKTQLEAVLKLRKQIADEINAHPNQQQRVMALMKEFNTLGERAIQLDQSAQKALGAATLAQDIDGQKVKDGQGAPIGNADHRIDLGELDRFKAELAASTAANATLNRELEAHLRNAIAAAPSRT